MIQFRDGFYADVRTEDRSRTTISYQAGILLEMKTRVECRAFLRVYDGKLWYYAAVTDLSALQKTLDGLYDAATPNEKILDDPIVRRFERNRDTVMRFAECSVRDISAKEKQALLLSYLPLLSEDGCVTMPQGTYRVHIWIGTVFTAFSPAWARTLLMITRPAACPFPSAWLRESGNSPATGKRALPALTS